MPETFISGNLFLYSGNILNSTFPKCRKFAIYFWHNYGFIVLGLIKDKIQ